MIYGKYRPRSGERNSGMRIAPLRFPSLFKLRFGVLGVEKFVVGQLCGLGLVLGTCVHESGPPPPRWWRA